MKTPNQKITATKRAIAKAFEQWLADYQKDPKQFEASYSKPKSYGEACADELIERLT